MPMPLLHVLEAKPLSGFRLALVFSDGSAGVANLADDVRDDDLKSLADPAVFAAGQVKHGTVSWAAGDVDLSAEFLHARANGLPPPYTAEAVRSNLVEVSLRQLREVAGATQAQVAVAAAMNQGDVSRLERRNDALVSSLRRYVEAIGGRLELVVTIGDEKHAVKVG